MKLATRTRIASSTVFATLALIAIAIHWANGEVELANRQRQQTAEIAAGLNELRQVAFEYLLNRQQRARDQERNVSGRLDRLLAQELFADVEPRRVLDGLRERSAASRRIFSELMSTSDGGRMADRAGEDEAMKRFESQLTSQLLILQQENLVDAFRLMEASAERINMAQRRVVWLILAGLVLIAVNTFAAACLINRSLLRPLQRLHQATREVASGNWNFQLGIDTRDEIGDTSRNFDAMTRSLRDSFDQVQSSNRELAALNQEIEAFSYSVSHDLRGPLRAMDGFSLALLEDYSGRLDADGQDALQRIRAACQRMGQLIDDLLRLSYVTRAGLTFKSVDLGAMARNMAQSLMQQEPGRQVRWEIEAPLKVMADAALLEIALQNLLENAWKFTRRTDEAVIRVGSVRHDDEAALAPLRECFVSDNGVGFDMAYADRLFGAFQRLHRESEFPGTGIGLAIVHRIFRRHGASVRVEAKPQQGATFYFSLRESVSHE